MHNTIRLFILEGAGLHNKNLCKDYQKLCNLACLKASSILNQGGSATEAVEAAVVGMIIHPLFSLSLFHPHSENNPH